MIIIHLVFDNLSKCVEILSNVKLQAESLILHNVGVFFKIPSWVGESERSDSFDGFLLWVDFQMYLRCKWVEVLKMMINFTYL